MLTKTEREQYVRNADRAATANKARAGLFLRLHCDAVSESGFSTYYPVQKGSVGGKTGPSSRVLEASKRFAPVFHRSAIKALDGLVADRGLRTDQQTAVGAKQGALTGSIHSEVPVLLVEMAGLKNRMDESALSTPTGIQKMAAAIAAGVRAVLKPPVRRPANR